MGTEPGCQLVARGRATTLRLPILMNDSYTQGELKKSSEEVCWNWKVEMKWDLELLPLESSTIHTQGWEIWQFLYWKFHFSACSSLCVWSPLFYWERVYFIPEVFSAVDQQVSCSFPGLKICHKLSFLFLTGLSCLESALVENSNSPFVIGENVKWGQLQLLGHVATQPFLRSVPPGGGQLFLDWLRRCLMFVWQGEC